VKLEKYLRLPTDEEMLVSSIKETIHEEIAEKLLIEFLVALRYVDVKCFYDQESESYIICFSIEIDGIDDLELPHKIYLSKREFVASFLLYEENSDEEQDPVKKHIEESYSDENIRHYFDVVVTSIDEWIARNIRILRSERSTLKYQFEI
jgi:hypothetical protein